MCSSDLYMLLELLSDLGIIQSDCLLTIKEFEF